MLIKFLTLAIFNFQNGDKCFCLLIMCGSVESLGSGTKTRLSFLWLFFLFLQEILNVLNNFYSNNVNLASSIMIAKHKIWKSLSKTHHFLLHSYRIHINKLSHSQVIKVSHILEQETKKKVYISFVHTTVKSCTLWDLCSC